MKALAKNFSMLLLVMSIAFQCQHSSQARASQLFEWNSNANRAEALPVVHSPIYDRLDSFFQSRHKYGQFNGTVLVAKGDKVYYQGAFGYENFTTKDTLSTLSSFQLASVSKTFTATAVLHLVEKGLISLEDTLGSFFPNFPYRNVRVKDLLSHRSGLPNYLYFCNALWDARKGYMSNDDLIAIMQKHPRLEGTYKPNTRFEYSNTNYALLASIVERVTGEPFPQYMKETFFVPLGMKNTWVFDARGKTPAKYALSYGANCVKQKDDPYDGIYGDKGIYSSAADMYRWNLSFYQNTLIGSVMQKEAYSPQSFERPGVRNYGYGWRLIKQPDNTYTVYHNGWWHGNNTVFYRNIQDSLTVIILSNRFNKSVYNVQPIFKLISASSGEMLAEAEE